MFPHSTPQRIPARIPLARYNVVLEVTRDSIHVFDHETDQLLKTLAIPNGITPTIVSDVTGDGCTIEGEFGRSCTVQVELFECTQKIDTEAGYLFDIQYDPTTAGGSYFGYYEWGMFRREETRIRVTYTQAVDHMNAGLSVSHDERTWIFLGFVNGDLIAMDVPSPEEDPSPAPDRYLAWQASNDQGIHAFASWAGYLVSGHHAGFVKVWDPASGTLVQSTQVSPLTVRCLAPGVDECFAGTGDGHGIAVDPLTGQVAWDTPLSSEPIVGCNILPGGVTFVDNAHGIYFVSPTTGALQDALRSPTGVSSQPVLFKNWGIVGGAGAVMAFQGPAIFEACHTRDQLARALCLHPAGIILGDDDGTLSWWTYPGVTTRMTQK